MFRLEDCPFNIFRHDHIRQSLHVFKYIHTSILLGICLLRQYQKSFPTKVKTDGESFVITELKNDTTSTDDSQNVEALETEYLLDDYNNEEAVADVDNERGDDEVSIENKNETYVDDELQFVKFEAVNIEDVTEQAEPVNNKK